MNISKVILLISLLLSCNAVHAADGADRPQAYWDALVDSIMAGTVPPETKDSAFADCLDWMSDDLRASVDEVAKCLVEGRDLEWAISCLQGYTSEHNIKNSADARWMLRTWKKSTESGQSAGLLYWVIDCATGGDSEYDWTPGSVPKRPEVCSLLVSKVGCDVNQPDSKGETPLHLAVKRNRQDIVWLLLRVGAKTSVRDSEDKTPIDYAQDDEMAQLLRVFSPGVATRP